MKGAPSAPLTPWSAEADKKDSSDKAVVADRDTKLITFYT